MGCSFYEFRSGLFGGDYYCIKKGEAVSSDIYYKYCRNYSYGDCPIYKSSSSSSCFITTIVCNILEKNKKVEDSYLLIIEAKNTPSKQEKITLKINS